ncbi:MAG: bifunctional riboflavin kinase/FAD synthetase [Actinomycetota bacterium]|nr:bifunctional riboflavin kinase/FAD synthetase [Actinomycetota bacterium]
MAEATKTSGTLAPAVVCLGVFDGVHRGHRALIDQARMIAGDLGIDVAVMTFDPHPMAVLRPESAPKMLADIDERKDLLLAAGVDDVYVLNFTETTSRMTPRDFVERVVVNRLNAQAVVVGKNFWFGHEAAGDAQVLTNLGAEYGFEVYPVDIQGHQGEQWSSTNARRLIAAGEVAQAAAILDRYYRLNGLVMHGDERGRELGFPTANLQVAQNRAIPADGVYAGWVTAAGLGQLPAAISIGTNPQFDGQDHRIEAYVLDRADLDLYDQKLGIDFVARVRGQAVFSGSKELVAAMQRDVAQTRKLLTIA